MARRRLFENRRVFSFNLDVENMRRMESLYPNLSEKLNELIVNHLDRIQHGLDDIEFKKQQVQEEINSLKEELGLLDKEKGCMLEAERRAEQEAIFEKKRQARLRKKTEKTKQILASMGLQKIKSMSELSESQRNVFWKKWEELRNDKAKA